MYAATGVPTATMISIATPVSRSETRTDASAGPRTSAPHCHGPMRASSAVNGYNNARANSAADVRATQWRGMLMRVGLRPCLADHSYSGGR